MKTVLNAGEIFTDEGTKKAFLEMWKNTNMMDLYEGNLKQYFQVITSILKDRDKKNRLTR